MCEFTIGLKLLDTKGLKMFRHLGSEVVMVVLKLLDSAQQLTYSWNSSLKLLDKIWRVRLLAEFSVSLSKLDGSMPTTFCALQL